MRFGSVVVLLLMFAMFFDVWASISVCMFYVGFEIVSEMSQSVPVVIFHFCFYSVWAGVVVRWLLVGGASCRVLVGVRRERRAVFAILWVFVVARERIVTTLVDGLSFGLLVAALVRLGAVGDLDARRQVASSIRAFFQSRWLFAFFLAGCAVCCGGYLRFMIVVFLVCWHAFMAVIEFFVRVFCFRVVGFRACLECADVLGVCAGWFRLWRGFLRLGPLVGLFFLYVVLVIVVCSVLLMLLGFFALPFILGVACVCSIVVFALFLAILVFGFLLELFGVSVPGLTFAV